MSSGGAGHPFVYPHVVRFREVDSAGIVFFPRIFEIAHDAYEAWLGSAGFPLAPPPRERGYGLPLARAEAEFERPLRLGQELRVRVIPVRVGRSSFTIRSEIADPGGALFAVVTTVHVCVDPATGRSTDLPPGLRRALEAAASMS